MTMHQFTPEDTQTKYERAQRLTKGLPGKSSGYFDGTHYYYDQYNNKYYSVDIDYNISEISKESYDSIS